MRAAPRARIEPAPGAAVTKIKTTKINSGAFFRRITNFNSPENYPLYGIATPTCTYQLSLLCTALQSVIYDLVAATFITGEDRHVILILASVA